MSIAEALFGTPEQVQESFLFKGLAICAFGVALMAAFGIMAFFPGTIGTVALAGTAVSAVVAIYGALVQVNKIVVG